MPDETDLQADLIKKFRALKTHEEKCEFFNDPKNYPILGRIYNAVHFPPTEKKSASQQAGATQ